MIVPVVVEVMEMRFNSDMEQVLMKTKPKDSKDSGVKTSSLEPGLDRDRTLTSSSGPVDPEYCRRILVRGQEQL